MGRKTFSKGVITLVFRKSYESSKLKMKINEGMIVKEDWFVEHHIDMINQYMDEIHTI